MKLALSLIILLAAPAYAQTTWYVDVSGTPPGDGSQGSPYTSLQFAIDAATTVSGDTLVVAQGTYAENIDLSGKDLLIDGSAAATRPVVDGANAGPAITIANGETAACTLRSLEVRGGSGANVGPEPRGGGLFVSGASPTLESLLFVDNSARVGGGAYVEAGSASFSLCSFDGNSAQTGGGIAVESATLVVRDCEFTDNHVSPVNMNAFGGAVNVGAASTCAIANSTFADNISEGGGGGGVATDQASTSTLVLDSTFIGNIGGTFNSPGTGGGIHARGPLEAHRTSFLANGAVGIGFDGVFQAGGAFGGEYFECTFVGNSAQLGGGVSSAEATDCTFEENIGCADGSGLGGGAYQSTLTRCELRDNWTCGGGGGASDSDLVECDVLFNRDVGGDSIPALGGGLRGGTALHCTIRGNVATPHPFAGLSEGGGAYSSALTSCLVTANVAEVGGGVRRGSTERVSVVGNVGLLGESGIAGGTHDSTVVHGNFGAAPQANGTFTYCNLPTVEPGVGNVSADPLFFGPGGGDLHLMVGSPNIDAGNPALPLDPDGTFADIGAITFDAAWVATPGNYCLASDFAPGCMAELSITGPASLGMGNSIPFEAHSAPSAATGLLVYSNTPGASGIAGQPVWRRALCIGAPFRRSAPTMATAGAGDCPGVLTDAIPAQRLLVQGFTPGDRLYAQFWFRTPGITGFALSDGVEVTLLP